MDNPLAKIDGHSGDESRRGRADSKPIPASLGHPFFEWPLVFGFVFPKFLGDLSIILCWFLGVFVVIIVAVSKSNQRLGDLGAGTVVVDTRVKTYLHETVFLDISHKDYTCSIPGSNEINRP